MSRETHFNHANRSLQASPAGERNVNGPGRPSLKKEPTVLAAVPALLALRPRTVFEIPRGAWGQRFGKDGC